MLSFMPTHLAELGIVKHRTETHLGVPVIGLIDLDLFSSFILGLEE